MNNLNTCKRCFAPLKDDCCEFCEDKRNQENPENYLPIGSVIHERYIIGKFLDANGQSATYIAMDDTTETKVVIEEYFPLGREVEYCSRVKNRAAININSDMLGSYKSLMESFIDNAKALARLKKITNLVPITDVFKDNNTAYVVYQYIEGQRLTDFVRDHAGELSWKMVKNLFPPLLHSLCMLHEAKILHRGICPDNILVTPDNELYLTHFCVASARTQNSELQAELYPFYSALEQYDSCYQQGSWTDVYGFCALLYRLLTGCGPTIATSRSTLDNVLPPKELNETIPDSVSDAIMKGLILNTEERTQKMSDLVPALFGSETIATTRFKPTEKQNVPKKTTTNRNNNNATPRRKPVQKNTYVTEQETGSSFSRAIDKIKAPFVIGVLLILIIFVILMIVIKMMGGTTGTSAKGENSSSLDNVVPIESTIETSTKSQYDSVMPDLLGKYYDVKKEELQGWINLDAEYDYSEDYPADQIFWQEIAEGEGFTSGSTVKVKVSLGPAKTVVPEYNGKTETEYRSILENMGIPEERITKITWYTQWYETGMMVKVIPDVNAELNLTDENYTITIYVAQHTDGTSAWATEAPTEAATNAATQAPTDAPATQAPVQETAAATEAPATEAPVVQEPQDPVE